MRGVVISLAVVLFTLLAPRLAVAQAERISFLSEKLRDPDFRVRTNAALALGAVDAEGAVAPLCGALGDSVDVVRQSAAAGLQRLNRQAGVPCLDARARIETNDTVRGQISKALAGLANLAGGVATENPNAKYYVQIAPVTNGTDRRTAEIESLVRAAVMAKLDSLGVYQIAPANESIDGAKATMSKRKLKTGFYLTISVQPMQYASGISVGVSVAISSYPGKSLKATLTGSSSGGGRKGDLTSENQILDRATQSAVGTFAQNVEALL